MATIPMPIDSRHAREFGTVAPADASATGGHRYQADAGQQDVAREVEEQHARHHGDSRAAVVPGEAAITTAM